MKCKSVCISCSLLLLLVACSGDKSADTPASSPAKAPQASSQSSVVDASAPKSEKTSAGGSCRSIVEAACVSCHSENRICQKLGRKDKSRWLRTIDRMIKRGTKLSSADRDTLADCLANESSDIVQMCK